MIDDRVAESNLVAPGDGKMKRVVYGFQSCGSSSVLHGRSQLKDIWMKRMKG
jgi:hypothetical protein